MNSQFSPRTLTCRESMGFSHVPVIDKEANSGALTDREIFAEESGLSRVHLHLLAQSCENANRDFPNRCIRRIFDAVSSSEQSSVDSNALVEEFEKSLNHFVKFQQGCFAKKLLSPFNNHDRARQFRESLKSVAKYTCNAESRTLSPEVRRQLLKSIKSLQDAMNENKSPCITFREHFTRDYRNIVIKQIIKALSKEANVGLPSQWDRESPMLCMGNFGLDGGFFGSIHSIRSPDGDGSNSIHRWARHYGFMG